MEIFTDVSGEVILKKYSPVGEMSSLAQAYAEALVSLTGQAAAVCDGEQVIALAGPARAMTCSPSHTAAACPVRDTKASA